jgi:glycosyltransferase involved in cell wall biosynthesis
VKYWLLTSEYPPFFGGGIGTYCHITANMMAQNGHEVSVFVNDPTVQNIKAEILASSVRVIRFNPSRTHSSEALGHVTNVCYEFAHIVRHFVEQEGKPDIIESQEYLGIAYYLLHYKYLQYEWCKDIPVVITMHSPSMLYMEYNHVPLYSFPNYWICEMERFCLQAADLLISPSKFIKNELEKRLQLNNKNIAFIPNPYRGKALQDRDLVTGDHNGEIIFYGKLTVQKGIFYLLQFFRELWDKNFDRPLYLVGGQNIVYHPEGRNMGDLIRSRYKSYINRNLLKLEKGISPDEIYNRLSKAQVIVVPSANDNLPYVVFEMMAMGNIVLVSRQGGQAEVVEDGIDGFVFDLNDPETFYTQLKRVLNLTTEQRVVIARNAIKKISQRYDPEKIYRDKIEVLNKITLNTDSASSAFPFIRNIAITGLKDLFSCQKNLLSVIITFYNSGKYIDEVIDCLSKVDYAEKEIIIVNDGSTDQLSLKKLEFYNKQPGVTVINKKNMGLAHTRNLGAQTAHGEFLAFLDADDKVDTSYYSKAIRALKKYSNLYFVGAWTQYFEGSSKVWPTFTPEPPLILYHNLVNSAALVYKRQAFLEAGQNDYNMTIPGFEDYESVISMLSRGYRGTVLPEILFYYRVRSDSMVRGISRTKKLLIYEYISKKHTGFYNNFASEIFSLINANGSGLEIDNPSLDYDLARRVPFGGKISLKLVRMVKYNKYLGAMAYRIYRLIKK